MDYDFSRLSTRSFEQLIQSLAHSVIGPSIVIFGDGPDGGREATFKGQIPFPNDADRWHGYGIVQAKFKQRTENSGKDGDWALQELKKELEKFQSPIRGLQKPEYYIFATNVVLTPVAESGGKDKLTNYLQNQKKGLGLKDFRIWDYDQLRVMLDSFTDVRTTYAAWITAGDVLAKLIESMHLQRPDFREVMCNYLQKELCADQYVNLNQAGHQPKDRILLAQVFVDLPVDDQNQPNGAIGLLLEMASQCLNPSAIQQEIPLTTGLYKMPPTPGRLVFIGGPGQGKTTLSQFICQLFRVALLQQEQQLLLSPEAKDACAIIIDQSAQEGLAIPPMPRFPLRVVLNSFAAELAGGKTTSLFDYLLQRISKLTDRDLSSDDLRSWLATYPWLLVLDGLDEVPASSNRDQVITAVQNFLVDAQGCNADLLLLSTTRPQGYNDDFSHRYYQHYELLPLDVPRALHYADRLLEQRWGGDKDKIENLRQRLQRAGAEIATARLMCTPLQVTIMAMLVETVGQPPRERWRLFNDYYRVIYSREKQRDIPAAELLNTYQADIDAIHQRVGMRLQADSELSGTTEALLTQNEFAQLVQKRLEAEGHTGQDGECLKQQIIDAAIERLVFLVAPQADKIGFEIRSLQEFMAAQCLMTGSDKEVQLRLRAIAPAAHWRNVFLFAAGRCFFEKQHLRDTLHALCHELNEGDSVQAGGELEKTTLAGSRLALEILEDGALATAPGQLKLFANLALRLLELPSCAEQARLAKQYVLELKDIFQTAIENRFADSIRERRLGAWRVLLQLQYDGEIWAQDLVFQAWPTDVDEGIQIIKACDGINFSEWLVQKWRDVIFKISPIKTHFGLERNWNTYICSISDNNKIWSNFIRRFKEKRELKVSIEGVERECFNLNINAITIESDSNLSDLLYLPEARKEWQWLISTLNFELDLDCSKERLAELLLEFSSWTQEERQSIAEMRNRLPWPILSCILMATESDDLRRLAKAAQDGELGDREDWINAQKRWQNQGLTISDFHYVPQGDLLFDNQIANHGFPFTLSAATLTHSNSDLAIAIQLFDLWQSLSPSLAKKQVANHVLFVLSCAGDKGVVWEELKIDDFKSLIADRAGKHLPWTLLGGIPTSFWDAPDFVNILEELECDSFISYNKTDKDFIPQLELLALQHPNSCGLLRLLSIACLTGHRPCSEIKIDIDQFSDHRYRLAALIIKFAQATWNESQATQLAEALLQLDEFSNGAIESVLAIIALQKLSGRQIELFLNNLYKLLPYDKVENRRKVFQAMLDQQRHRCADATKLAVEPNCYE